MRCLYCGKELALLKRWTGGGEFCSDSHRQQYQEEYNQLALNRLLQAKPPSEAKAPGTPEPAANETPKKTEDAKKPDPAPRPRVESTPVSSPPPVSSPKPITANPLVEQRPAARYSEPESVPVMVEEPVIVAETVVLEETAEEPAPAELGSFLVEIPIPAMAEVMAMAPHESDFEQSTQPALPEFALSNRETEGWGTQLFAAGRITLEPSSRVLNYTAPRGERRLEARDLGHSAPIIDFRLGVANGTGLPDLLEEPMDFLVFPHPPQGSPPLWQEAEKGFTFDTELGALAHVTFGTTGLQDNEDGNASIPAVDETPATITAKEEPAQSSATTLTEKSNAVEEPRLDAAKPEPAKPDTKAPAPPQPVVESAPTSSSAPTASKEPPAAPVAASPKPSFLRPPLIASKVPAPKTPEAPAKPAEPRKTADAVPALVKKPLPLTLHGLAAGRGKPVQIISSAVASGVELQVPRSNAVPMRPVMILGPAATPAKVEEKKPPERPVLIKADPKKIQPTRLDPRFANNKGRKPEVRVPDQKEKDAEKKEPEKIVPAPVTPKEPAARPVELKKPAEAKPEPQPAVSAVSKEPQQPAPYSPPDLGLPSLSFQDSGSFWSRLPMPAKIGIAAGVVLAITGMIVLGMKGGNGAAASTGPRVVAGQPLAALDSGWITDWGAEPGVRRQHEISILRPSMNLTDYRLEFEAQIETKAIGWVYRAQDEKNYYVSKLEIVKPGLEPTIALVRFAVTNGEEQPRSQFPLKIPVRIDTLYKIRFDAVGDHFTTWVQNQQVDDWTDDHIKRGGVGLYNERDERMSLRGSVNVVPLVIKR